MWPCRSIRVGKSPFRARRWKNSPSRPRHSRASPDSSSSRPPALGDLLARTWARTRSGPSNRSTRISTRPPLALWPNSRARITRVSLKTSRSPGRSKAGRSAKWRSVTPLPGPSRHSSRLAPRRASGRWAMRSGGRWKWKSERFMAGDDIPIAIITRLSRFGWLLASGWYQVSGFWRGAVRCPSGLAPIWPAAGIPAIYPRFALAPIRRLPRGHERLYLQPAKAATPGWRNW